VNLLTCLKA
jgi:hypothetical protein